MSKRNEQEFTVSMSISDLREYVHLHYMNISSSGHLYNMAMAFDGNDPFSNSHGSTLNTSDSYDPTTELSLSEEGELEIEDPYIDNRIKKTNLADNIEIDGLGETKNRTSLSSCEDIFAEPSKYTNFLRFPIDLISNRKSGNENSKHLYSESAQSCEKDAKFLDSKDTKSRFLKLPSFDIFKDLSTPTSDQASNEKKSKEYKSNYFQDFKASFKNHKSSRNSNKNQTSKSKSLKNNKECKNEQIEEVKIKNDNEFSENAFEFNRSRTRSDGYFNDDSPISNLGVSTHSFLFRETIDLWPNRLPIQGWQVAMKNKISNNSKSMLASAIKIAIAELTPISYNRLYTTSRNIDNPSISLLFSEMKNEQIQQVLRNNNYYKNFWYNQKELYSENLNKDSYVESNDAAPMDKNLIKALISYVPRVVIRRFLNNPDNPVNAPEVESYFSCVLFVDISGFSAMTASMDNIDAEGVEKLTNHINEYFSSMITLINEYGGDIVKFAGDALIVIWPTESEDGLFSMALLGCQCAYALQKSLNQYKTDGLGLNLHIGIGAGKITGVHVGGVQGRLEFFITGAPLSQACKCGINAKPGEVFISMELHEILQDELECEENDDSFKLLSVSAPISLPPTKEYPLINILATCLKSYVPPVVLSHLGTHDFLAELRTVSVIFVNLKPECFNDTETFPHSIQMCVSGMQAILATFEGSLRQFLIDDKGCVLIAAFGLPPLSHEDDIFRAVKCSLGIESFINESGPNGSIGLTTGRAFCGAVGNEARREYAMVGDVVNMSARLMSLNDSKYKLLVDRNTYNATKNIFSYDILDPVTFKGYSNPIPVYAPTKFEETNLDNDTKLVFFQHGFIGRQNILDLFNYKLKQLTRLSHSPGHVLFLEGDAGTGKTRILKEFGNLVPENNLFLMHTSSITVTATSILVPWMSIFNRLLQLEMNQSLSPDGNIHQLIIEILKQIPDKYNKLDLAPSWESLVSLLNPLLTLDFPETDITHSLDDKSKFEALQQLLLRLLQILAPVGTVIALDDAHNFDSTTWTFTLTVCQQVKGILFIIASRPLRMPSHIVYRQLLHCENASNITIGPLEPMESVQLTKYILGVNSIPNNLSLNIKKLQGNPYIIKEIILNLKESGMVYVENNEAKVKHGFELMIPSTVQQIITTKLDKLTTFEKSIIKIASVIGQIFSLTLLIDLIPGNPSKSESINAINSLIKYGFFFRNHEKQGELAIRNAPKTLNTIEKNTNLKSKTSENNTNSLQSNSYYNHSFNEQLDNQTDSSGILKVSDNINNMSNDLKLNSNYDPSEIVDLSEINDHSEAEHFKLNESVLDDKTDVFLAFKSQTVMEVVYTLILFSKRRQLHEEIALWYEDHYDEASLFHYSTILAYHWKLSEKNPKRAAYWYSTSGQRALNKFSNQEAVKFFLEAINLNFRKNNTTRNNFNVTVRKPLKPIQIVDNSKIHRKLGQAYLNLGLLNNARYHLLLALKYNKIVLSSVDIDQNFTEDSVENLNEYQVAISKQSNSREIVNIFLLLGKIAFYTCNRSKAIYFHLLALRIAKEVNSWKKLAKSFAQCIVLAGLQNQHSLVTKYIKEGLKLASGKLDLLSIINHMCGVYYTSRASWSQSLLYFRSVIELSQKTGDRRLFEEAHVFISFIQYLLGNFEEALNYSKIALNSSRLRGDTQCQIWALTCQVYCHMNLRNIPKATSKLDQVRIMLARDPNEPDNYVTLLGSSKSSNSLIHLSDNSKYRTSLEWKTNKSGDLSNQLNYHSLIALLYMIKGEVISSLEEMKTAEGILLNKYFEPTTFFTFPGFFSVPEIYLRLLYSPDSWKVLGVDKSYLIKRLSKSLYALQNFSTHFVFSFPRYYLLLGLGLLIHNSGNINNAIDTWKKGLELANQYKMMFEESMILSHLNTDIMSKKTPVSEFSLYAVVEGQESHEKEVEDSNEKMKDEVEADTPKKPTFDENRIIASLQKLHSKKLDFIYNTPKTSNIDKT